MSRTIELIQTDGAPAAIGPYAQARRVGDLIFTSGSIALTPAGEWVEGGIEAETRQALANLEQVLKAAGSGLDHVVKTTVFLADLGSFQAMNAVYAEMFGDNRPARSTVEVAALPKGAAVEIEAIALAQD